MRLSHIGYATVLTWTFLFSTCHAGVASKAIQEAVEMTAKKFGREVAEEGLETMSAKMARLAAKHGDDVVAQAFTKVGPRAGSIVAEAGEHSGLALRLLAQHGDHAISIAVSKEALEQVARHGDDAAVALIKHGPVGERLIKEFGQESVLALASLTPQNGRRLAMMAADDGLKPELLSVVAKYGDEACDFVWRNKGAFAVSTTLATFVASPEEFLSGTRSLAEVAADAAIKPLAMVPGTIAGEAAKQVNWNFILLAVTAVLGFVAYRWGRFAHNVAHIAAFLTRSRNTQDKEVRHDG